MSQALILSKRASSAGPHSRTPIHTRTSFHPCGAVKGFVTALISNLEPPWFVTEIRTILRNFRGEAQDLSSLQDPDVKLFLAADGCKEKCQLQHLRSEPTKQINSKGKYCKADANQHAILRSWTFPEVDDPSITIYYR